MGGLPPPKIQLAPPTAATVNGLCAIKKNKHEETNLGPKKESHPKQESHLSHLCVSTSSTARGGGGSFQDRQPIGELKRLRRTTGRAINCRTERILELRCLRCNI